VANVALYKGETWFRKIGQLPLLILCGLLLLMGVVNYLRK
jgi:apolipoprotein N-acyltransferase